MLNPWDLTITWQQNGKFQTFGTGNLSVLQEKLENVFVKHYAPNHMLAPKEIRGIIKILWNFSKNYKVSYTIYPNCMPDIMILDQTVLQIVCLFTSSQVIYIMYPNSHRSSTSCTQTLQQVRLRKKKNMGPLYACSICSILIY